MTAKEFLQQAIDLERQIDADMLEACRVRSIAEKVTATFTADRVTGGQPGRRIEDAAIRLSEIESDIIADIESLVDVKRRIRTAIDCLDRPEEKTVLRLRYLCGKKWEEICVQMNYSWKHIHRIHRNALKNMTHNDT